MINLIDESAKFNESLTSFPASTCTVSILGSQSSGKSTLLNHVFSSSFPVLNSKVTRQRCTKGVWFQSCLKDYLLIDTQGFDSVERGLDEKIIQRQVGMLSLAISDVLIINLWMNEIGRYQGAHCGVLRTIVKMSERIINTTQPTTKKIIFVVKDCTSDADRSILKAQLSAQISTIIRTQSKKPTIKLTADYHFMSHYLHRPQQYEKQAKQLFELIASSKQRKSALSGYGNQDRLLYVKQLWNRITSSQMELDMKSFESALKSHSLQRMKIAALDYVHEGYFNSVEVTPPFNRLRESLLKAINGLWIKDRPVHISNKDIELLLASMEVNLESEVGKWFIQVGLKREEEKMLEKAQEQLTAVINQIDLGRRTQRKQKELKNWHKQMLLGLLNSEALSFSFNSKITQTLSAFQLYQQHQILKFQSKLEQAFNLQIDQQLTKFTFNPHNFTKIFEQKCKSVGYQAQCIDKIQVWGKVINRAMDMLVSQVLPNKLRQFKLQVSFQIFGDNINQIVEFHTKLEVKCNKFLTSAINFFGNPQFPQIVPLHITNRISTTIDESMQGALRMERKRFKLSLVLSLLLLYFFYNNFIWLLGSLGMKKKRKSVWKWLYWLVMMVLAALIIWRKRSTWEWLISLIKNPQEQGKQKEEKEKKGRKLQEKEEKFQKNQKEMRTPPPPSIQKQKNLTAISKQKSNPTLPPKKK